MLKLAYASPRHAALPQDVARSLENDWQVASLQFDAVAGLHALPNFIWLNLGRNVTQHSAPWTAIRNLGTLQHATDYPAMIDQAFSYFPSPEKVEIDMKGEPDVQAALSKYSALYRLYLQGSARLQTTVRPFKPTDIPDTDLRDDSGNLSAKRVANLFGISVTRLGEWIDRKKAALSKSPASDSLQPLLQPYANISLVRRALDGNDVAFRKWLRTAHPLLENQSPLHWLSVGKTQEIAEFVHDALTGQPT